MRNIGGSCSRDITTRTDVVPHRRNIVTSRSVPSAKIGLELKIIKMKTVAALSLLATPAMAFFSQKPAAKAPAAPTFSIDTIPGAIEPTGLWDPLGFAEKADEMTLKRYREAELTHGRVAMLAVLGHLVTTAGVRLPGDIAYGVPFSSVKNGFAALETMPAFGIFQIVAFVA